MASDARYDEVARTIRQHGTPNPQFPKDVDIEYGTLKKHLNAMNGLGTVLKNMKEQVTCPPSSPSSSVIFF